VSLGNLPRQILIAQAMGATAGGGVRGGGHAGRARTGEGSWSVDAGIVHRLERGRGGWGWRTIGKYRGNQSAEYRVFADAAVYDGDEEHAKRRAATASVMSNARAGKCAGARGPGIICMGGARTRPGPKAASQAPRDNAAPGCGLQRSGRSSGGRPDGRLAEVG